MNQLKQFKKQHTDKKIKTSGRIYMLLVLLMFIIVIVDSFEHDLPFYYILYGFAGIIIGRFVAMTQDIILLEDKTTLSLKVRPIGLVITFLLLIVRYFAGQLIMEQFNVIWATDAVYLLFIGIYFSKVKTMLKQVDENIYTYLFEYHKTNKKS